ncbi:MAG: aminotransferase class I/II-fold pyridoxal phosphate-dependent enzyme [Myxococcota bacterium]|nr:aminotransferase class I/II-fold pyridoxal phosphate-dependent enzyme [Myxococcota bacterium]
MAARIPRFSPSFSPAEAWISLRHLSLPGDEQATVAAFEQEFAEYIGVDHAIMVPSARYGFYLLLQAWGFGEEDEVILPALTYFAIPALAKTAGMKPVFADIGLTSHVLDPESFEKAITPRTKAVVPTHLFGTPCDMDAIREIARAHDIVVIEDCAQSTGARWNGERVGSLGDAAYYTFGLTKNITTLSGAMVTTNDDAIAQNVRKTIDSHTPASAWKAAREALTGTAMMFATHPWIYPWSLHPLIVLGNRMGKDPIHDRFGETPRTYPELPEYYQNARPRAVQAAVGRKQLQRIESLNGARSANGRYLDEALANLAELVPPSYPKGSEPIYMSFVVHHTCRDELAQALRRHGVDTTVGYMSNCSNSELFPDEKTHCPNANKAMAELLHSPVHPNLSRSRLNHIAEATRRACLEIES